MLTAILLSLVQAANPHAPGSEWQQFADPGEVGFSVDALNEARAVAETIDSAAVMLIWRGKVVVAWGDVDRRFRCHSVRKSILSALYGMHVDAGEIELEATLAELGIDDRESLTETEKSARIVDLLSARSGVYHPAAKEPSDMRANRPARGSHEPGTHWWYNNWDFNTLLPIFEQQTGTRVFEEFDRRLAQPLGMQDWRVRDGLYQLEPSKSRHAAYAFRLSTRDLARFGQLFLNAGAWNGEQIVPAAWVAESTRPHSDFDNGSYGYMWWSYPPGCFEPDWELDALDEVDKYSARGTGGQFILVVPSADLVFVHRGDTDNDRRVSGGGIWRLAEIFLTARQGEAAIDPELKSLDPIPFANPGPEPVERDWIEPSLELVEAIAGTYEVAPGFEILLHEYDGRLFALAPQGEVELFAETETRWFARGADVVVELVYAADGTTIESIRGEADGRPLIARRK